VAVECPKCKHENPPDTVYCGKCATPLPDIKEAVHTKTMETPIEDLTGGSTFAGRCEIIEELGKGGMGKVYRVEEALRISEVLKDLDVPFIWGDNTYARASIASLLGKKEQAVSLLREAISQGVTYPSLHANMNLEPLLDYPPYKELIRPKK